MKNFRRMSLWSIAMVIQLIQPVLVPWLSAAYLPAERFADFMIAIAIAVPLALLASMGQREAIYSDIFKPADYKRLAISRLAVLLFCLGLLVAGALVFRPDAALLLAFVFATKASESLIEFFGAILQKHGHTQVVIRTGFLGTIVLLSGFAFLFTGDYGLFAVIGVYLFASSLQALYYAWRVFGDPAMGKGGLAASSEIVVSLIRSRIVFGLSGFAGALMSNTPRYLLSGLGYHIEQGAYSLIASSLRSANIFTQTVLFANADKAMPRGVDDYPRLKRVMIGALIASGAISLAAIGAFWFAYEIRLFNWLLGEGNPFTALGLTLALFSICAIGIYLLRFVALLVDYAIMTPRNQYLLIGASLVASIPVIALALWTKSPVLAIFGDAGYNLAIFLISWAFFIKARPRKAGAEI